jgi:hypothetical protein
MSSGSTTRFPRLLTLSRLSIPVVIIIIHVLVIVAGPA